MTPTRSITFGNRRQRGFWLRYFLGVFLIAALISSQLSQIVRSQGIVDCVFPGHIAASRVQGEVVDPFGVAVPGVTVTLVDEQGSRQQTSTDSEGRFRLSTQPGKSFEATFPNFQRSQTVLSVGEDAAGLLHPRNLHVILGLNGSYCAWITTSEKEFHQIISSNKKRSEESAQRNATQK